MLLLLGGVFWITVAGANVPSEFLMRQFHQCGAVMRNGLLTLQAPLWLQGLRTGWRLADGKLGGGGYAAADGDFFSVVYIVRGFRFAATDCL